MNHSDYEKFREGIAGVYGFYDKDISDFAFDLWWNALNRYDLKAIIQAFNRHVVNPEAGKWLPKPADIVKMLEGSTLDSAMAAWTVVDKTLREKGAYIDVVFDDPIIHRVIHDMGGWVKFGEKNEDEWPFVAKEFQTRYQSFKSRNEIPDHPGVLVGIANAHNRREGHELEPYLMIGNVEKCKAIAEKKESKPMIQFTKASNALNKDSISKQFAISN